MRHPYAFTLDLMRLTLDRLPAVFPAERKRYFDGRLSAFEADPHADQEVINSTLTELGKESWPYRCAYADLYEQYGRAAEEVGMLKNLDAATREKYERFIHEGGKLGQIAAARSGAGLWQPSPFERYFTPEEKYAIEQAWLAAREAARKEIDSLIAGKKKTDYENLVREHLARQARMAGMIGELRGLAKVNRKWESAILDNVRTIEDGWSVVERQPDEERLARDLEYWRGTLETFLK